MIRSLALLFCAACSSTSLEPSANEAVSSEARQQSLEATVLVGGFANFDVDQQTIRHSQLKPFQVFAPVVESHQSSGGGAVGMGGSSHGSGLGQAISIPSGAVDLTDLAHRLGERSSVTDRFLADREDGSTLLVRYRLAVEGEPVSESEVVVVYAYSRDS